MLLRPLVIRPCRHKQDFLKKIKNTTFEWCTLCGTVVYHFKDGGIFKLVKGGIYVDFAGQTDVVVYFNDHDPRMDKHEHQLMRLTNEYEWCKECGALQIKKVISIAGSLEIKAQKAFLFPKRKEVHDEIYKEAGLIK